MRAKEYLSSRAAGFLPDDRPRDPAPARHVAVRLKPRPLSCCARSCFSSSRRASTLIGCGVPCSGKPQAILSTPAGRLTGEWLIRFGGTNNKSRCISGLLATLAPTQGFFDDRSQIVKGKWLEYEGPRTAGMSFIWSASPVIRTTGIFCRSASRTICHVVSPGRMQSSNTHRLLPQPED